MLNWNDIEPKVTKMISAIFNNADYHNFSIYERRKMIYEYLCDTLEFDEEELHHPKKNISGQIMDVLDNDKGICNSICYVYKILLEKVGVYSLVLFCKDDNDDHTILLVDNGNGTLSFDDVSIGIYSKKISGIGVSIEERFDYDLTDAESMKQGVNKISGNNNYVVSPSGLINFFFGKKDDNYMRIKPRNINEENHFFKYTWLIESYKKYSKESTMTK